MEPGALKSYRSFFIGSRSRSTFAKQSLVVHRHVERPVESSSMSDALRIILDTFADRVGLHVPVPAVGDGFALVFDKRWVVNFADADGGGRIRLFAGLVGATDAGEDSAGVSDAGNVVWFDAGGMDAMYPFRLGFQQSTGRVIVESVADAALLDSATFADWLGAFLNHMEKWEAVLSTTADRFGETAAASGTP